MRHRASPITVERMCPTCIGLATLGAEKSTTKVRGLADCRHAQPRVVDRGGELLGQPWSFSRKLMKPGPATSGGWQRSATSNRATTSAATSRGFLPNRLASGMAKLAW